MESIIKTGQGEFYRDLVDFQSMASQMEMMCNHDHTLGNAISQNETLSSLMDGLSDHDHDLSHSHDDEEKDKHKKRRKRKQFHG